MSSSISNSKLIGTELKCYTAVLLVLLVLEVSLGFLEEWLSFDLRHIKSIPTLSHELVAGEGDKILFLGNSLTQAGVDVGTVRAEMAASGRSSVHLQRVFPDDSTVAEWYYSLKHHFLSKGRLPDVVVVGFVRSQLRDDTSVHYNRIARHYSSLADIGEIFGENPMTFGERVEFILAWSSASFAHRERVSTRILDILIPHYRDTANRINVQRQSGRLRQKSRGAYRRLSRLIKATKQAAVSVVLVAIPLPEMYHLDQELVELIEGSEAVLIDARSIEDLSDDMFSDGFHLGPVGARVYSRFVARHLAGMDHLFGRKDTKVGSR